MQINCIQFAIERQGNDWVVEFEAINKQTIEMIYSREEFLKYFDLDTALKLENYLHR